MKKPPSPINFFSHLVWLNGKPLLEVIEPYRQKIFTEALYSFDSEGYPVYNFVLTGRAKKNWKTADLVLAGLYRLLVWESHEDNGGFILANDEAQAGDDLALAKKLIAVNEVLDQELLIRKKEIERRDNGSILAILPARDIAGEHGKTYLFIGFDEIHAYRNYDLFEALAADPFRRDALTWITSYDSTYNTPGVPLFDFVQQGKARRDPKMYFSWYAANYTTDPAFENLPPEGKANPSMASWGNPGYLEQQKRRLPTHKYRRLHLNLPGMPEGAYFDAEKVMDCVIHGRRLLRPQKDVTYKAFVDMSGGSSDDATLAIGHENETRAVLDLVVSQTGRPPFNPRHAVKKFARILKRYRVFSVIGDRFAGETFRQDFSEHGISYQVSSLTKHQLYEAMEPIINANEVELLDVPTLHEQLLGLVIRGTKIDHLSGEHDDWSNAAAGVIVKVAGKWQIKQPPPAPSFGYMVGNLPEDHPEVPREEEWIFQD